MSKWRDRCESLAQLYTFASVVVARANFADASYLVFHGGSGSTKDEIREAVVNGVVKMNVDTDTQWAYLTGIRDFIQNKKDYLQSQVGNPDGPDKPNKKQYDPRVWVREGEKTLSARVKEACEDLGNSNRN